MIKHDALATYLSNNDTFLNVPGSMSSRLVWLSRKKGMSITHMQGFVADFDGPIHNDANTWPQARVTQLAAKLCNIDFIDRTPSAAY